MPRVRKTVTVAEPVIREVAKRAYTRKHKPAAPAAAPVVHDATGATPTTLRGVHPLVVARAMQLAGGDVRRMTVVNSRTITVR